MNSHATPNDLLHIINSVAVVIFLPFLQRVGNRSLRRTTTMFTPVNRMIVAFTVEAIAMAYVAGIQKIILQPWSMLQPTPPL